MDPKAQFLSGRKLELTLRTLRFTASDIIVIIEFSSSNRTHITLTREKL